jgi:AhpC/TSA family
VIDEELKGKGFTVVAIALDEADAAREWVDAAAPSYPTFVDPDHVLAERLAIFNVPTVIWIDEDDRIVRAPVMAPVDDMFKEFTNVDSTVHHEQLRAWVHNGELPFDEAQARAKVPMPTEEEQLARSHRRLGAHLYRRGRPDRAAAHFARAVELQPMDFTIRRGSLPMNGGDPFGQEFFDFWNEWEAAGRPGYKSADRGG